jgi:hypothetical protein
MIALNPCQTEGLELIRRHPADHGCLSTRVVIARVR